MPRKEVVMVQGARIFSRNFAGKEGKFNAEGNRNFCLLLDTDIAEDLTQKGWNIKWLLPRDPADPPQAFVQVKVKYGDYPPKIVLITSKGKTPLSEEAISVLDFAEIENIDIILNPSAWEVGGKTGVKPYVKSMYITIVEDELSLKYRDLPDSAIDNLDPGLE